MDKRKWLFLIFTILAIFAGALVYASVGKVNARANIPDTPDSEAIQEVIKRSYTVYRGALHNGGDVSEFDQVFVDTPDYRIEGEEARRFVEQVLGPEAGDSGGYLTAMRAKYIAYGCAVRKLKDVEKTAKKADRDITETEIQSIQDACYGVLPPVVGNLGDPVDLSIESIEIQGNRAIARFDDGRALAEATLLQKDGKWLIANIEPIKIHF